MDHSPAQLERLAATAAGLADLPWGAHALAGAALIAGLIMWFSGRRFVRPVYAALFALAGAGIGFAGPAAAGFDLDPYMGLAAGLIAGLVLGAVMYRMTMAVTLGVAAAVAAPMVAAAVIHLNEAEDWRASSEWPSAMAEGEGTSGLYGTNEPPITGSGDEKRSENRDDGAGDLSWPAAAEAAARIRRVALAVWSDAMDRLDAAPPMHRLILLLATLAGAGVGFALGFSWPGRSAAIATAFVGAGVWLGGGAWLATLLGSPPTSWGLSSPLSWLLVWVVAALAGTALQWTALRPRADEKR